jgi:hypothetical protein
MNELNNSSYTLLSNGQYVDSAKGTLQRELEVLDRDETDGFGDKSLRDVMINSIRIQETGNTCPSTLSLPTG